MSDQGNPTAVGAPADTPTPLTDWTDRGAFRAAFLEVFRPEDRAALKRAGAILASQVVSGDAHREPAVISELEAAYEDARMLAEYLLENWNQAEDTFPTARQHRLAERCRVWAGEVASIALAIRGALDDETEDPPATAARPSDGREARPGFDRGAVVFRETFLCRFTDPEDAETVRRAGELLLTLAIGADYLEAGKSNSAASELAAVGTDVARIEAYLRQVVEEVEGSEVSTAEAALAERARDWIVDASDLAHEIACEVEESEARKGGAS